MEKKGNKMDESLSYRVCYALGYILSKTIIAVIRFLITGIVETSKRHTFVLISYIVLATLSVVTIMMDIFPFPVFLLLVVAIISGIYIHIKETPIRNQKKYFSAVFTEVNLVDKNKTVPLYFTEKALSKYVTCFSFLSMIPLSDWWSKKAMMEMQFNAKIIDIVQSEQDNRVISLLVENEPLPTNILWNDSFLDEANEVEFALGVSHYGTIYLDLQKYPHSLIAGETGSGKSNILKCLIYQALMKEYDIALIDFKRGVSFSAFSEVVSIFYEYETAMEVLKEMVKETQHRLDLFRSYKVDNLDAYNKIADNQLKRIIIFIDELAELLKTRDKEISKSLYDSLESLTRLSRAAGIHLIMGIQRPDSTVVNGQIKNNVSFRVCGRFVDKEPSRIMLNSDMASNLQNTKGRFIVKDNNLTEIQCFNFLDSYANNIKAKCNIATDSPISPIEASLNENTMIYPIPPESESTETESKISFDFSDID